MGKSLMQNSISLGSGTESIRTASTFIFQKGIFSPLSKILSSISTSPTSILLYKFSLYLTTICCIHPIPTTISNLKYICYKKRGQQSPYAYAENGVILLLLSYRNNDVMRCNIFFFFYMPLQVCLFWLWLLFLKDKNKTKRLDLESNFFLKVDYLVVQN